MAGALLIEEPTSLVQQRQALGISLEELAMVMLQLYAQDQPYHKEDRYISILHALVTAFDYRQLPSITRAQQSKPGSWSEGVPPELQKAWHEGPLRDTYLTWVQSTLLKIINEVLSTRWFTAHYEAVDLPSASNLAGGRQHSSGSLLDCPW
jgi:hypothetical protein